MRLEIPQNLQKDYELILEKGPELLDVKTLL